MPTSAALTSTQNALGFLGSLYQFGKRSNTLLKLIGGSTVNELGEEIAVGAGWRRVFQREYSTNVDWDLPAPAQPTRLEGANAPTAATSQPAQSRNVVQIFHETVEATYLAQSEIGRLTSTGTLTLNSGEAFNNFSQFQTQLNARLTRMANDYNFSAWNGTFANPANPTAAALGMRGIIPAITTTVLANGGTPRALTKTLIQNAYKAMIDNAGVQPEQGLLLVCNTNQLNAISNLYETQFNNGQDRMVGGVMVRRLFTPFGILDIVLELDVPQSVCVLVNPDIVSGTYLPTVDPQTGATNPALSFELLAKTGSTDRAQIYGQLGIDYGPEWAHAKIVDLT